MYFSYLRRKSERKTSEKKLLDPDCAYQKLGGLNGTHNGAHEHVKKGNLHAIVTLGHSQNSSESLFGIGARRLSRNDSQEKHVETCESRLFRYAYSNDDNTAIREAILGKSNA